MCVTDRYDMTLAVNVALNPNTTNQAIFESAFLSTLTLSIYVSDGLCGNASRLSINVSTVMCPNIQNTTNKTSHPALEFWT